MGFPTDMFAVLFMIPRVVGWLSHWNEFLDDPENKIVRPRQHYVGHNTRDYVPLDKRPETNFNLSSNQTSFYKRNITSKAKWFLEDIEILYYKSPIFGFVWIENDEDQTDYFAYKFGDNVQSGVDLV